MKDNKKKVILFFAIIIVAVIIVVLAIAFGKKDNFTLSGNNNVIASLNANSQAEVDNKIISDLQKNRYSLKDAKVYLDPYGNSPLSALIAFRSNKDTDVKVTIKGKNGNDIVTKYPVARDHYIPVYALYQDYKNTVEIELGTGEKQSFTIEVKKIENVPVATQVSSDVSALDNSIYFLTSPIAMSSFAVDAYGEVRWLTDETYYHNAHVLENGHILIGTNDVNDDALVTRIVEIDLLGRIYNEYYIDEGYLNDFFVKEDGNIIMASKKKGRNTFSEYIIEIDGKTGKIVKNWDVFETLKKIDPVFTNGITNDQYFYNSGIEYDAKNDSLLLTYWGGEFVINLSYKDGSIKWIFADPKNLTSAFNSVLLKGAEGFVYPKSMHSASLDGNTLRVFDNGYSTIKNNPNSANLVGAYSSANTYRISGNNIELVSSIDEDKKLFSYALADYKKLANNSELVLFGRELKDADFSKGFDVNEYLKLASRIIEYKDGKKILDLEVDVATHMINKISLEGNRSFEFIAPNAYTSLLPSPKEDITPEIMKGIKNATESVNYKFGYSKNLIEHNVLFMSRDEAKLVLIDKNEAGAVYTLKTKEDQTTRRIVTDLAKGKYYVYILENGITYKTGSFIEIN